MKIDDLVKIFENKWCKDKDSGFISPFCHIDDIYKLASQIKKECIKSLPHKVTKIEHWGHEIDCYYCVECQEGIGVHPEHLDGFNEAVDKSIENINKL